LFWRYLINSPLEWAPIFVFVSPIKESLLLLRSALSYLVGLDGRHSFRCEIALFRGFFIKQAIEFRITCFQFSLHARKRSFNDATTAQLFIDLLDQTLALYSSKDASSRTNYQSALNNSVLRVVFLELFYV